MSAAQAVRTYPATGMSHRKTEKKNLGGASVLKQVWGAAKTFFADPFFWDLYEAEHSADAAAMTELFEKYGH